MADIDTVLFDAAGVIFAPSWVLSALNVDGSRSNHKAIVTAFQSTYHMGEHPMSDWERGKLSFEEFRSAMGSSDHSSVIDWHSLQMQINPPVLFDVTCQVMADLRQAGFRVGVITNTMHEFKSSNHMAAELNDIAEVWVRSCDVGFRKPEPEIFRVALNALGTTAEKTLFLDDSSACVAGAQALGMQVIQVDVVETAMSEVLNRLAL